MFQEEDFFGETSVREWLSFGEDEAATSVTTVMKMEIHEGSVVEKTSDGFEELSGATSFDDYLLRIDEEA